MVFFGEYEVSFSGQGRIILPKKIRALLKGNAFVLSKGSDICLAGYDQENWEKRTQALTHSSVLEETLDAKKRVIFSSIIFLEIDDQGRFVIPKNLLDYGDLSKTAVIIGAGDHFEIWNPQKWNKFLKQVHPSGVQAQKM